MTNTNYYITANLHRPSFDGRHDTYAGFNYSDGEFRDERRDCDIFEKEADARGAFDCADAVGFKGFGTLKIYLTKCTITDDEDVTEEVVDEKSIEVDA